MVFVYEIIITFIGSLWKHVLVYPVFVHEVECVAPDRETNKEHHKDFVEETFK